MCFNENIGSQKVSGPAENIDPKQVANYAKSKKATIFHASNTRHERSKSPNYGNKPRDNHCFASVFFVELSCFKQVFFAYQTVFAAKYLGTCKIPYQVIQIIPGKGSNEKQDNECEN